jgi:diguanylate cyclase (GGDEF)-like protein
VTQAVALHHGGPTLFACPTPLVACVQLGDTIARMATGHITSDPQTDLALRKLGAWPAMIDDLLDELTEPQPAATELSSHLHELQREASTDDLTGVANRRAWRATLRTYLEEGRAGSVLVCDLDEFKQLNDTHGHQTGDAALALAAQLLGQHGLVGRLGGDEFGLFVPGDSDPVQVATRILDALPLVTGSAAFGMSIGISRPAGTGRQLDELLAEADAALYRAKGAGKNRLASAADAA